MALGGALGAVSRYLLSGFIQNGPVFPWGTFGVNALGCFILGFLMYGIPAGRVPMPDQTRLLVGVGFIGALTTFSTLSYETLRLLESSDYAGAGANMLLSLVVGLLAVYAGKLGVLQLHPIA